VFSGSTAIATKVISGDQIVFGIGGGRGALAVSTTIGPHGDLSVAIGGTALDTTLSGEAEIQSGGTAIGMAVKSGGLLGVADGGTASGVVSSGGVRRQSVGRRCDPAHRRDPGTRRPLCRKRRRQPRLP
jgi:autotransporter passenger strand-loop-strand repeat protein